MSTTRKVLFIQDQENGINWVLEALDEQGYALVYELVGSLDSLAEAVLHQSWDMAIVDSSRVDFSVFDVLGYMASNHIPIPVLLVVDTLEEEAVADAMIAGVKDIILRGNSSRLVRAAESVFRQEKVTKHQQAATSELESDVNRYRSIVEDQTDAIYRSNLDGVLIFANRAFAKLNNVSLEGLIGRKHKDVLTEENFKSREAIRKQLSIDNPVIASEQTYTLVSGEKIWMQWLDRLIIDPDGRPVEYQGVGRDITAYKQTEKEILRFAENLERYVTQLQVAAEIARDAATARELDNLLNQAVSLIKERFGFYHAAVFLIDERGEYAVMTAAAGKMGHELLQKNHKLKIGEVGIVGHVAITGEPLISLDVRENTLHLKQPLLPDTRSEMAIPLKFMNQVIGVLDVQSKQVSDFDGNDLIVLQTMADQLAIAIDNLRLMEETQRRSQELTSLYEAALATSSVLDTDTLLECFYEQVQRLINPDTFMVSISQPSEQNFSIAYAVEKEEPVFEFLNKQYRFAEGGLTGWVLENRQPLLIHDIDSDPLPIEPVRGLRAIHAWLGVPLISRSNLVGAVSIQSFRPGAFDLSHQRFLESLAAQTAVALENARLFESERAAREQAETLRDVAQVIEASLEPQEVIELILKQMKRILTFDTASVLLYDQNGKPSFVSAVGYDDLDLIQSHPGEILEDSRILAQMKKDLQPVLISDVQQHPDWIWVPGAQHVRSFIGVPVVIRENILGVLMVDSNQASYFTREDVNSVQALARQMAVTIENSSLFEAERIAREKAEALRDAAQAIVSTLSLAEVIEAVLEQLARIIPYDSACVYLVEGNRVRIQAGRGYEKFTDSHTLTATAFPLDAPFVQKIVGTGQMYMITDVTDNPEWIKIPFSEHIRSYLGVPLRVRDQVIGFFSLDRTTVGGFRVSELEIAEIFAAQTSAAIENAYLFEAEEKRVSALEILRQVSLKLTASLEPEAVLEAILEGVFKLIPDVQDAHIFTYDGSKITFGSSLWHDGRHGEMFYEPRSDGLTYTTARTGEMILVNDFRTHPLFKNVVEQENWVGSIVGIPLKIGERVVGVLNVANQTSYAFSEAELYMLRLMGDQAALAIENARLFDQTMMERRHISLLYDVGQAIATSLEPDKIVKRSLVLTCRALDGKVGAIWTRQTNEDFLTLQALYAHGLLPLEQLNQVHDLQLHQGHTIVGWCAENGQALIISDVMEDERWTEIPYIDEEIHAMIVSPINEGQNLLGVMTVLHDQVGAFTEDHLDLLQSICQQVGLALSNASKYQDINHLVDLLASEQNRLESLIEMLPAGVLLLDKDHTLLVSNPLGEEYLSILSTEAEGEPIIDLGKIPLKTILEAQDHTLPIEITLAVPQRCVYEVQASQVKGDTVQWVLTIRDVTHERETQERVQMQERLATVGQLAAGIAHDFNNIMAAIVVYADLVMMEPSLSSTSRERLSIIQQQIQRASSLIRQILDFSRRSVMEQSTLHLLPFMKEMQKLLARTLPETIEITLAYQEAEYAILADPTRLQQVFMNLAVNSRDAMPNGGSLNFHLARIHLGLDDTPPVIEMASGEWVRVSIVDSGVGIPLENQSRIFEPFFTTKSVGQGTGLGLAQVYGIVRQHEGFIDVSSQPGKGTQFDIYLPALVAETSVSYAKDEQRVIDGSGKTVLLVEDDATTRSALQALLEAQGFQVILASNGTNALKTLNTKGSEIHLVVSDIVMPEMGGMDLYTIMQIRWPEIQILFITGHPLDSQNQIILERGKVEWLQKPFSIAKFNQAIQNLVENM